MYNFKGKVAVVTGGIGGIGRAVVQSLASCGSQVVVFDLDAPSILQAVEGWRGEGLAVSGKCVDVTDYAAVSRAMGEVESEFGGIDQLVNVAGGRGRTKGSTMAQIAPDDWAHVVDLNLNAPFYCIKSCAESMRRRGGGAIVTIGSLAGLTMPMGNSASYTAAKAGIMGLTRHAAFELARDNIRVNAVLPGPVMTPQLRARATPEMLDAVPRSLPLGRWIEASEIAQPVLFFLSDAASACVGTHVVVDGGLLIGSPTTPEVYFKMRGE